MFVNRFLFYRNTIITPCQMFSLPITDRCLTISEKFIFVQYCRVVVIVIRFHE